MTLDESTRRNLELTETIRGGDVQGQSAGCAGPHPDADGQPAAAALAQPTAAGRGRHRAAAGCGAVLLRRQHAPAALREKLTAVGDLERWTNRVVQGMALPRDLVGIRAVLARAAGRCLRPVRRERRARPTAHCADVSGSRLPVLPLCRDVLALLEAAIAEDPPATLGDAGHHPSPASAPSWTTWSTRAATPRSGSPTWSAPNASGWTSRA